MRRRTIGLLTAVFSGWLTLNLHAQDTTQAVSDSTVAAPQDTLPSEPEIEYLLGDLSDGSRFIPVHRIKLYDHDGGQILSTDEFPLPFSTRETCGQCHNYAHISDGWHFNAADSSVNPGRRGQPWFLTDEETATQIPISHRNWPGAYTPEDIGVDAMEFVLRYGSHIPGGGVAENDGAKSPDNFTRWLVSGNLEINCLACHDANRAQDMAENAQQIKKENFRWAAAASADFVKVEGSAKSMPDNYDIYMGLPPDVGDNVPPTVHYNFSAFNEKNEVFFDIMRAVPNEKCQFCHSTHDTQKERFEQDDDVHLASGMLCVDCHTNGLDHMMTRGYEGESNDLEHLTAETLSCEGCHLASDDHQESGRFGAPEPLHAGIPPVHFDAMTCTACHSGILPDEQPARIKTSRAHALGTHGVNKSPEVMPLLSSPVFAPDENGKIAPHKLLWPSFWAKIEGEDVRPMHPDAARSAVRKVMAKDTVQVRERGQWYSFTQDQVAEILDSLAVQDSTSEAAAFVSGGKLHRLQNGRLISADHTAAEPYYWAIGHDVRPTGQSLGVRGCNDCHAVGAPFYFSDVAKDSPLAGASGETQEMTDFMEVGSVYSGLFAASFWLRPVFKWIMIVTLAIVTLLVLHYVLRGLGALADRSS